MIKKFGKTFLLVSILLILTIGLVACSGNSNSKSVDEKSENKQKTDEKTQEVQKDRVFVVPLAIDFASIAPSVDVSAITKEVFRNMHDAVYKYDPKTFELKLSLAESVEKSVDGKSMKIYFKKGIKFHNGDELKADDVIYTFERLAGLTEGQDKPIDPTWARLLAPEKGEAGKIQKVDDYTVEFMFNDEFLKKHGSNIDYALADAFIIPKSVSEEEQKKSPIGAGAYKFVEYMVSDFVSFERFEDYHGQKPQIKNVEFRMYADPNAQYLAFESGEIDLLVLNSSTYDSVVNSKKDIEVVQSPSQDVRQIWLNQAGDSKFNDIRVRQAINYAVDKQEILKIANGGRGIALDTHLSPANPAYNENLKNKFTFNPEKAKELLKDAGYENGFEVDYYVVSENQLSVDIATVVADQIAKVGIKANIKAIPWSQFYKDVYKGKQYEMAQLQIVAYPDAYRMLSRFISSGSNVANHKNLEYDKVIENASKQLDSSKQVEYMKQAQQILVDDATNVFLIDQGVSVAISKYFTGYVHYPFAYTDISAIKYK